MNKRLLILLLCCALLSLHSILGATGDSRENEKGAGQERIAFTSSAGGSWQIWMMNPDGSSPEQLTRGSEDFFYPAWSPVGRKLAFAGGSGGIWTMERGGVAQSLPNLPRELYPSRLVPRRQEDCHGMQHLCWSTGR